MKPITKTIAIDWSGARGTGHARSIGWASLNPVNQKHLHIETNPLSRTEIATRLLAEANGDGLTIAGIDANFSIAGSVIDTLCGPNAGASDLWHAVERAAKADAGFYGAAFAENHPAFFWMSGKKPTHLPSPLPQRATEIACGVAGLGYPESPFKLIGPKQVGKGGLAVMRLAHHLKQTAGDKVAVWPFEKPTARTKLIIGEIYPRLFWRQAGFGSAKVRDVTAINNGLKWYGLSGLKISLALSDHQSDAAISAAGLAWMIKKSGLAAFSTTALPAAATREGWIMGLPAIS